jgi:preprotein translocase SecE subunit
MDRLIAYFKETQAEVKQVTFPTMTQTITFTLLVIGISVIVAVILGGADLGLREGLVKLLAK